MATRATYEIDGTTFYCHWDGYPSGAAVRFCNMIAAMTAAPEAGSVNETSERNGGACFAFIRGNMDAQPTTTREGHMDTEWHYRVTTGVTGQMFITVFSRSINGRSWITSHTGELSAWLRLMKIERSGDLPSIAVCVQKQGRWLEMSHSWREIDYHAYATVEVARAIASAAEGRATQYHKGNPNRDHAFKCAQLWAAAAVEAERQEA